MKEKLNHLNKEQEELMITVRNEYLSKFFTYKDIDKKKCQEFINSIYKDINLPSPLLIITDSPLGCQYTANLLKILDENKKFVSDNVRDNVSANVWANVRDNVSANVWDNVRDNVWANVRDNVSDNVWDNVRDNVWANVRVNVRDKKLEFFSFGSYIGCSALSWTAFYDYFTRIGILDHEKFNEYKKHTDLSIYDTIQLKNVCIVSRLPISIKRKGMRLHSEDSPAIEFKDGYKLYYWSGLTVPEKLIMSPETITKNDILSISNAEVRRCYMEKLGAKKYYDILSDGKGLKLIDSCIDNQGNIMKLWETTINDDIINKKVQFLECECPSTHRIYNIYPPNQQSKTCKEAKYSTFLNVKGKYRQGDVMLQDISKDYDNCLVET